MYSFTSRARIKVVQGLKLGTTLGFVSSVVYAVLLMLFILVIAMSSKSSDMQDGFIAIYFLIFILCVAGILPATIIGFIGGSMIGFILAFWKNKIHNFAAIAIGIIVGMILAVFGNYISWLNLSSYGLHDVSGNSIDFQSYLFPSSYSPYFMPGIVATLMSAYVGWKINNLIISESNFPTKE
jgi:hypothetical protein